MTTSTTTVPATGTDTALKDRHRSMWASGNYPAVASEIIAALGPALVAAAGIGPGDRVLDVAAGSGNAAIPAAATGAAVVASDLTPELLAAGAADAPDLDIRWETGDAEALPYADAGFDAVLSCVGVMFAPHHEAAAAELLRVCRPGGTIALLSWTPGGFIGRLFAAMKPYVPAPPPGAQPPPLWGDEAHVRQLLGTGVTDVRARTGTLPVARFGTGQEFVDYFRTNYGPTLAAYRGLADDPDRTAALDRDLLTLTRRFDLGGGAMEWEYLLLTATRA
jgi:SAM-dependent methyltransferase